jgi:hypothetical protein
MRMLPTALFFGLLLVSLGACTGDLTEPAMSNLGSIAVSVVMSGNAPDVDGFLLSIDGGVEHTIGSGACASSTSP